MTDQQALETVAEVFWQQSDPSAMRCMAWQLNGIARFLRFSGKVELAEDASLLCEIAFDHARLQP